MKRDTSYADKRIAEVLARPLPKHLEGVFEQFPMTPPRTDVAISLESSKDINPIRLLKDQEEVTFGGVGGRAGIDVRALLAPSPTSIMDLKPFPVSQARQDMFAGTHHHNRPVVSAEAALVGGREAILSVVGNALFGPGVFVGVATTLRMNPNFQDALVHELRFGKMERHPRKALWSFNKASKAMVKQFLKEVKRHG